MIKDILVYLDGTKEDDVRLSYAFPIAQRHDAFLTGLLCVEVPDVVSAGEGVFSVGKVAAKMQAQADEHGDKAEKELQAKFDKLEIRSELRRPVGLCAVDLGFKAQFNTQLARPVLQQHQ